MRNHQFGFLYNWETPQESVLVKLILCSNLLLIVAIFFFGYSKRILKLIVKVFVQLKVLFEKYVQLTIDGSIWLFIFKVFTIDF